MIACKSCKNFGDNETCTKRCKFYKEKEAIKTLLLRDQILKLPTEEEQAALISDILRNEGLDPITL